MNRLQRLLYRIERQLRAELVAQGVAIPPRGCEALDRINRQLRKARL